MSVAAAIPLRPVRSTLVAPILPEPMARMSAVPASRVRINPNRGGPQRTPQNQPRGADGQRDGYRHGGMDALYFRSLPPRKLFRVSPRKPGPSPLRTGFPLRGNERSLAARWLT